MARTCHGAARGVSVWVTMAFCLRMMAAEPSAEQREERKEEGSTGPRFTRDGEQAGGAASRAGKSSSSGDRWV